MNKKVTTTLLAAAMVLVGSSQAAGKSWRINNNANRKAHFANINAAMSSSDVQDGDTLYLDPGCVLTNSQTVSKKVTIIGTGYSLESGTHEVAAINAALYLEAAGIKVMGVAVTSSSSKTWYVRATNITIERCSLFEMSITAQYATIRQCIGTSFHGNGSATGSYCTIENCIFTINSDNVPIRNLHNATIRNNYMRNRNTGSSTYCMTDMRYSLIENNIILHVNKPDKLFNNISSCIFSHNVLSCAEGTYSYVSAESNLMLGEADEAKIFTMEGTACRGYQLKDDSPAKGYATDGGDCGPFGGTHPYIPSGYPLGMPRFVSNSAGTRATDGTVSFSNQVSIQEK